jgi:ParB family chromosome partitioning protein
MTSAEGISEGDALADDASVGSNEGETASELPDLPTFLLDETETSDGTGDTESGMDGEHLAAAE